ncbi:helix-turn-helix transcriptional regulator [Patulibacter sp.]|uniref:helix-turn-helix transcriptional regulator n=1 Tax=Patulibacter sp. TaxID=1912859 RepID=UPI0027180FFE|nr:helix-turn-helix transcriptional regulator [Patulibacter sp.]MDO9410719.1 helix-turn-helix transcriptional regulator [Patulibacter sp.]
MKDPGLVRPPVGTGAGEQELPEPPGPPPREAAPAGRGEEPPRIVVVAGARLLSFGTARLLEEAGIPAVGTLRSAQGLARARRRLRLDAVVAITVDGSDDLITILHDERLAGLRRIVLMPPTSVVIHGGGDREVQVLPLTLSAGRLRRAVTGPAPALSRSEVVVGAEGSLTVRQQEVLNLVVEGLSNLEAAERLGVGVETVKTHLRTIYRKLGVRSRAEAVTRYMEVSAA